MGGLKLMVDLLLCWSARLAASRCGGWVDLKKLCQTPRLSLQTPVMMVSDMIKCE